MSQKVFVGDTVIVRDRARLPAFQSRPGIVTAVHSNTSTNITVFAENGEVRDLVSVDFIDSDEDDSFGWYFPDRT